MCLPYPMSNGPIVCEAFSVIFGLGGMSGRSYVCPLVVDNNSICKFSPRTSEGEVAFGSYLAPKSWGSLL